ncbi:MAG TPA: hypothetical protein PKC03_04100 [Dokdonella sp.]|jgi:hypothetical protein|nr:hypothetical protein [Dokdonella sp.]
MTPKAHRSGARLEVLAATTALVFAVVCWLVFDQVFDTGERAALPALTRQFLAIQGWWLGAGLLGAGLAVVARISDIGVHWQRASQLYALVLSAFSTINIGWGIVAMYLLTLPPADF